MDSGTNLCIGLISILLLLFSIGNYCRDYEDNAYFLDDKVISILKEKKPERLYNMYNYGGILIYNDILVFVDGRADLYSKYNYRDYLNISKLNGDYPKLIEKYNFDYFLVSTNYPINTYLKYSDKYELVYENKDKIFALYKEKSAF